jgi:hypothetical protein
LQLLSTFQHERRKPWSPPKTTEEMPMMDDAAIAAEGMESLTPWHLREPQA